MANESPYRDPPRPVRFVQIVAAPDKEAPNSVVPPKWRALFALDEDGQVWYLGVVEGAVGAGPLLPLPRAGRRPSLAPGSGREHRVFDRRDAVARGARPRQEQAMNPYRFTRPQPPPPVTAWVVLRPMLAAVVVITLGELGESVAAMAGLAAFANIFIVLAVMVWSERYGELAGRRDQHRQWLEATGSEHGEQ